MSYQTIDESVESGEPIELYEFICHADVVRRTSGADDYVDGNFTFTASSLKRSEITYGENPLKDPLKITFPRGDAFASTYMGASPEYSTTVTVKRVHRSLTLADAVVIWKGRFTETDMTKEEEVVLTFESIFTSVMRMGLQPKFGIVCRHALYSAACGVNSGDYKKSSTVGSLSENLIEITATGIGGYSDGYFTGGMVKFNGLYRFIVSHAASVITIERFMPGLVATDAIDLFPGCDGSLATCKNKFGNILNCGGFFWIPKKTPFDGNTILNG